MADADEFVDYDEEAGGAEVEEEKGGGAKK